jgi:hypothetical protein
MSEPSSNVGEDATRVESSNSYDGTSDTPIVLVDHTKPPDEEPANDADGGLQKSSTLTQKLTRTSLRQSLARRNYQRTRWQEGGGRSGTPDATTSLDTPDSPQSSDPRPSQEAEEEESRWGEGRVRRSRRRVKGLVKTPKKPTKAEGNDPDRQVDILYENQRGFFLFGIPHFSSKSLINFDPSAWLDARFKPSAVDLTNAQVPDPSWEWAWRTWYVDMSHDVDEEGWEYSFWFGKNGAWHGTHPWFHSFVRRRRWLRQRVRKHGERKGDKSFGDGHMLNADYFTIHSRARPRSPASSTGTASRPTSTLDGRWGAKSWEEQEDDVDVKDIPSLMKHLKESTIDREKMVVVRRFLDQGGDELYYLAEEIPSIMSLLVFQSSRIQLLSELKQRFRAATAHRDEHKQREEAEDEHEKKSIDNLLNAMNIADEQCRRLEYWSDIKTMEQKGGVFGSADHSHNHDHDWQGEATSHPEGSTDNKPVQMTDSDADFRNKGKAAMRDEAATQDVGVDASSEVKSQDETPNNGKQGVKGDGPKPKRRSRASRTSEDEPDTDDENDDLKVVSPIATTDDIQEAGVVERPKSKRKSKRRG